MYRFVSYLIACAFTSIVAAALPAQAATTIAADSVVFEDKDGGSHTLTEFAGKPIILNVWATWCGPCVQEMPSLAKLQDDYRAKGLVVLAISEDDSFSDALSFYKQHSISSLTPYTDKKHRSWLSLHARGLPTSILIMPSGAELKKLEGGINWQSPEVDADVQKLVEKK